MAEILVCDDDKAIVEAIEIYLSQEGHHILKAYDGEEALRTLRENPVDLLIIDVMMPKLDGIRATLKIREENPLPIIILSAKSEDADKILGLNVGADDYVTKPFELDVLYSRIQALLRRSLPKNPAFLRCDNIMLDLEAQRVYMEKEGRQAEIILSASEYELLRILMEHKGKTIARSWLLERIWDQKGSYVNDNTLTVTMKRLREKLFCPACLKTIRSLGYRMEDTV